MHVTIRFMLIKNCKTDAIRHANQALLRQIEDMGKQRVRMLGELIDRSKSSVSRLWRAQVQRMEELLPAFQQQCEVLAPPGTRKAVFVAAFFSLLPNLGHKTIIVADFLDFAVLRQHKQTFAVGVAAYAIGQHHRGYSTQQFAGGIFWAVGLEFRHAFGDSWEPCPGMVGECRCLLITLRKPLSDSCLSPT